MRISIRGMLILTLLIAVACWSAAIATGPDDSKRRLDKIIKREKEMIEKSKDPAYRLRAKFSSGVLNDRTSPSQFFQDAKSRHEQLQKQESP